MSAWIVGKEHIDLLVTAALAWELTVPERADDTGRMLWLECQRSVAYRYPNDKDGQWPGPDGLTVAEIEGYVFEPIPGVIDPDVVEEAARSFTYQSCEHPGWDDSAARALAADIEAAARNLADGHAARYGRLNENQQLGWDVYERNILGQAMAARLASTTAGVR